MTLLPASGSGNTNPVFSGWRTLLRYDCDNEGSCHGVEIRFDTVEKLRPEESAICVIRLFYPEYHAECARPEQRFVLMDGSSVRAHGIIVAVLGLKPVF